MTDKADREKTFGLPNFDPIVFEEIFGFNPCDCVEEKRDVARVKAHQKADEIIRAVDDVLKGLTSLNRGNQNIYNQGVLDAVSEIRKAIESTVKE